MMASSQMLILMSSMGRMPRGKDRRALVSCFEKDVVVVCDANESFVIVTFKDGTTVTWSIETDGATQPTFSQVGTAKNDFEKWTVYKDKYRQLYEIDGWKCYSVYWCF